MKKVFIVLFLSIVVGLVAAFLLTYEAPPAAVSTPQAPTKSAAEPTKKPAPKPTKKIAKPQTPSIKTSEPSTPLSEPTSSSFDSLVESWQEPRAKTAALSEMEDFRQAFTRLPEEEKMNALHQAMNLIPDENALLLAGILLDKSQPREILDALFADILNRSEETKLTILRSIHQDKTHPCWSDTDWILSALGD
jgi:hypothetical protein